uniref:Minor tail protein n=1 Tax=Streptomyces phage Geonosis TaxID=3158856 RepID=A0AAU7GWX9_9CAUD
MAKNQTPAKTPGVAIARVLRGLGLKQGLDFGVRGERKNGERIGTRVAVFGRPANQLVADKADEIERLAGEAGFHFNVSVYFTPSGIVWVHVGNYGEKTRQTHFLSATPAEPTETPEDQPLRDRAVALADESMTEPVTEGRARTLDDYVAERKQGIRTRTATPRISATLGAPRPAFGQTEAAPFNPYEGRAVRLIAGRKWGCGTAGQMWYFQTTEHGPRYTLRVYLGRAQADGWYLSGPGIVADLYMAGDLTTAMVQAGNVIEGFAWLIHRMEDVSHYYPKGQRVQGVDNYGVTCMGTVNGAGWGAVTDAAHANYGRTWADVTWDEMPHNRGTGRRSRPFTSDLIKH